MFILVACNQGDDELTYYSAEGDSCNLTCGFNFEPLKFCYTKSEVEDYLKGMIKPMLDVTSDVLKESKSNACIYATAKLSRDGSMTNMKILKTNDKETAIKVINIFKDFKLPPVPEGASCLTDDPLNEFPLSFRK